MLFLAFCHTDKNELTSYMREMGVIALAGIKNERGEITRGRLFKLDGEQNDIVKGVAEYHDKVCRFCRASNVERGKHVFLCGGAGTGKTLLLSETFKMRMEHCKRLMKKDDKPLRIIVVVWCEEESNALFQKTKNEYFAELTNGKNVEFYALETLRKVFPNILKDANENCSKPSLLCDIARELSKQKEWGKTILYVDEFRPIITEDQFGWTQNISYEYEELNIPVDMFVAVSPWVNFGNGKKYRVVLPRRRHPTVLAKQLHQKHRNGMKIHQLLKHTLAWQLNSMTRHDIGIADPRSTLDEEHDEIAEILPESDLTVWMAVDSALPLSFVLSLLELKYDVTKGLKVTLVVRVGNNERIAKHWCGEGEKRTHIQASDIRMGTSHGVAGYEDDIMVFIDCDPAVHQELLSRARERLIIVTTSEHG